jgi:type 1 glutamine amidotransferase
MINPNVNNNIPGLESLKSADLMVIFTRFRNLPEGQMQHIAEFVDAGKPVVGMRTATHAFNNARSGAYAKYHWQAKGDWEGGFGRYVLGETWVAHHGAHGSQATRGLIAPDAKDHPILRGVKDGDVFGPTDVYTVKLPLPGDSKPLVLGQVVAGMNPKDPPAPYDTRRKIDPNDPMMPVAWIKTFQSASGKVGRVFTTTMGASQDLVYDGTRRMLVNGCYWGLGLEDVIPEKTKVDLVGEFKPSSFRFVKEWKGTTKPSDLVKD